jgi:hypothetical protein
MKNYLVATAWIKDEAPYIAQWIEFHLLQGFDKFIFYDNGSTDNISEVLAPYIRDGIAEHRFYPPEVNERKNFWVMNQTINELKNEVMWLFHHSIDEYMFCPDGRKITDILVDLEQYSGVAVPWLLFNSGGAEKKENGLVIERFHHYIDDAGKTIKTIVRPQFTLSHAGNPHVFFYTNSNPVYANGQPHTGIEHRGAQGNDVYLLDILRINHYLTMSREEHENKMNKGLLDNSNEQRRTDADIFWNSYHPDRSLWKENYDLDKYIDIVKENIKKRYLE